MPLRKIFGITNYQKETDLHIAFEKLAFLATEMEANRDRPSDRSFWEGELAVIDRLDDGKSYYLTKAKEAYTILYRQFLTKHGLTDKNDEPFEEMKKREQ